MNQVCLIAVGPVAPEIMTAVADSLEHNLEIPTARLAALGPAEFAWDAARGQFSSSPILTWLLDSRPAPPAKLLAITEHDLFIPMLTFIYGQAQLGGTAALVSLARLRQEFYGFVADSALLVERACKEAMHEVGHTFGLVHCPEKTCAMALSTNLRQVDLKTAQYCPDCTALLREAIRHLDLEGRNDETPLADPGR